jgi:hypothetical protein
MNPLVSIQAAITRSAPSGPRMSLAAMLAAYTKDAAWASREDTVNGSLETGKAADLIVLDRNLFEIEPAKVSEVRVLLTLLEGREVYRAEEVGGRGGKASAGPQVKSGKASAGPQVKSGKASAGPRAASHLPDSTRAQPAGL